MSQRNDTYTMLSWYSSLHIHATKQSCFHGLDKETTLWLPYHMHHAITDDETKAITGKETLLKNCSCVKQWNKHCPTIEKLPIWQTECNQAIPVQFHVGSSAKLWTYIPHPTPTHRWHINTRICTWHSNSNFTQSSIYPQKKLSQNNIWNLTTNSSCKMDDNAVGQSTMQWLPARWHLIMLSRRFAPMSCKTDNRQPVPPPMPKPMHARGTDNSFNHTTWQRDLGFYILVTK